MPKVQAVIFDADGTLFNTKELIYAAYAHVAEAHNLPVPTPEQINAHMGKPIRDIMRGIFPPNVDVEALFHTNDLYVRENATTVAAFEGLEDMLRELQAAGMALAILTSGGAKIYTLLEHHGLADLFKSVVHGERIHRHKPDPEGFLLAATECGVDARQAVMVGDMEVDIQVGKNGGALATVGVTHGFGTRKSLEEAGADYIINSLGELLGVIKTIEHENVTV